MGTKKKAATKVAKKAAAKVANEQVSVPAPKKTDIGSVPVWEGGETRGEYLARVHQFRLDNNLGAN